MKKITIAFLLWKLNRVYKSCETLPQLSVADKYATLLLKNVCIPYSGRDDKEHHIKCIRKMLYRYRLNLSSRVFDVIVMKVCDEI